MDRACTHHLSRRLSTAVHHTSRTLHGHSTVPCQACMCCTLCCQRLKLGSILGHGTGRIARHVQASLSQLDSSGSRRLSYSCLQRGMQCQQGRRCSRSVLHWPPGSGPRRCIAYTASRVCSRSPLSTARILPLECTASPVGMQIHLGR